jgi:hypothetical protein
MQKNAHLVSVVARGSLYVASVHKIGGRPYSWVSASALADAVCLTPSHDAGVLRKPRSATQIGWCTIIGGAVTAIGIAAIHGRVVSEFGSGAGSPRQVNQNTCFDAKLAHPHCVLSPCFP